MDTPESWSIPSGMVESGGMAVPDRTSATALVTRIEQLHGDGLLGFTRRLGLDDDAAEDVVQEALIRLYDAIQSGTQVDDPRAWTFTVTYRLAMDEHRRRHRSTRLEPTIWALRRDIDSGDPITVVERLVVWNEVDRLPERQRAVLYLRYRADLPFETIGHVLGITASAARSHATQAVGTLRIALAGQDKD